VSSEVIRGTQRSSSEVIRGHQRPSEFIRGTQRSSSELIRRLLTIRAVWSPDGAIARARTGACPRRRPHVRSPQGA
jgi:hypothetical protein